MGPPDLTRADIRRATPQPPVVRYNPVRDFFQNVFGRRYRPTAGAAEYVLETGGFQINDPYYGYGVRSGAPLGYGQRPLLALHTRISVPDPTQPIAGGELRLTPLSANPNEVRP